MARRKKELEKPRFNSAPLREWAKEIQRLKDEITRILTEPVVGRTQFNFYKWNRMNSQEKKIFVFRAMEMGIISYKIEPRK